MPTILLSGCAILKNEKVLLIRKKGKALWELPGGIVKSKIGLEDAAVQKTKEQIGVKPEIIQHFTILEYQKAGNNVEATIFECDLDPEATFTPGENIEEIGWFVISDLKKDDLADRIGEDVKTILDDI
ncbi:NUDIX hydrolase [Candidatus Woesearchaeota archaeon]|nr:NUDIX hydrolase [Candidatus Woesearchaeota archaeon]